MRVNYRYYTLFLVFLACLTNQPVFSQDVSFSQMYATPLYLAPSFAGLTNGSRASLTYRDQWPGIPNTYRTYAFSGDHFFEQYNSGLGILFLRDDSGNGKLVKQDISVLYAYEIEVARGYFLRPGLSFQYAERNMNLIHSVFPSGQDDFGSPVATATSGDSNYDHKQIDAAASALLLSDQFWFGVTVDNLVKSDIGVTDIETYNPMKTSVFGGYKYTYKEGGRRSGDEQALTLAFNYRMQQSFNQLDLGTYWYINPLELGIWYRGIPLASTDGLSFNDGLIFIVGINIGAVQFGYSYDFTLSDLGGYSNGANELTVVYRFNQNYKKKEKRGAVPCSAPTTNPAYKYRRSSRSIF